MLRKFSSAWQRKKASKFKFDFDRFLWGEKLKRMLGLIIFSEYFSIDQRSLNWYFSGSIFRFRILRLYFGMSISLSGKTCDLKYWRFFEAFERLFFSIAKIVARRKVHARSLSTRCLEFFSFVLKHFSGRRENYWIIIIITLSVRLPLEEFYVEIPGLFLRISERPKIYLSNFIFRIFLIDFWEEKLLNNRGIFLREFFENENCFDLKFSNFLS